MTCKQQIDLFIFYKQNYAIINYLTLAPFISLTLTQKKTSKKKKFPSKISKINRKQKQKNITWIKKFFRFFFFAKLFSFLNFKLIFIQNIQIYSYIFYIQKNQKLLEIKFINQMIICCRHIHLLISKSNKLTTNIALS